MFQKKKRVRLKRAELEELNRAIHTRDGHNCIICGAYVPIGAKFHHEPQGADKSDEIEKGVLLCFNCHQIRHFGKDSQTVREKIIDYLARLYGETAGGDRSDCIADRTV